MHHPIPLTPRRRPLAALTLLALLAGLAACDDTTPPARFAVPSPTVATATASPSASTSAAPSPTPAASRSAKPSPSAAPRPARTTKPPTPRMPIAITSAKLTGSTSGGDVIATVTLRVTGFGEAKLYVDVIVPRGGGSKTFTIKAGGTSTVTKKANFGPLCGAPGSVVVIGVRLDQAKAPQPIDVTCP